MRTLLSFLFALTFVSTALADDAQYTVAATPLTLKVGANGSLVLTIKPGKGLHFNKDYPAKFTAAPNTNVKFGKEKLSSKDGDVKVNGVDGVVTVPVTGLKAGQTTVTLTGNFGVCTDEQCYMMMGKTLTGNVTVQ